MTSKPQLQSISREEGVQANLQTFPRFPQLATELRLKIWQHALESRSRLITIHLQGGFEELNEGVPTIVWPDVFSENPDQPCEVFVDGHQLMSKFLSVSREARQEALKFHRVRIPCRLARRACHVGVSKPEDTQIGTLCISPEFDFFNISSILAPVTRTGMFFVDFVHRLKTVYDPHHVGVLNLALDTAILYDLKNDIHISTAPPSSFLDTIRQLQEVFFLCKQNFGRLNYGISTGVDTMDYFITRSLPLMTLTPSFTRLKRDPRPITTDLARVNMDDPRKRFSMWQLLLKSWAISPIPKVATTYKFLVAHAGYDIFDWTSARFFLEREDESWKNPELGKSLKLYEKEDMEKAVKPALGFWLFPVDAFGAFTEDGEPADLVDVNGRQYKDLSGHVPELALSILPESCGIEIDDF